jgi:DNA-binding protein Fis
MTLPDERYRAVVQTRRFLFDLCNPDHTPRVPKLVRETARAMLRHYPSDWDMQQASEHSPHVFQERMEPLYRMVKQYEQDNTDNSSDNLK